MVSKLHGQEPNSIFLEYFIRFYSSNLLPPNIVLITEEVMWVLGNLIAQKFTRSMHTGCFTVFKFTSGLSGLATVRNDATVTFDIPSTYYSSFTLRDPRSEYISDP